MLIPTSASGSGGAWAPPIEQSVICDGGASMTRTFTSTSGDSWAIALRRSKFGATQNIISSTVYFDSSDRLVAFGRTSTRVFRDIGWYVFLFNPTSMYVNGPTGMDEVTGTGTYAMASIVDPVLCGSANRFEGALAGFWHGDSVAWSVSDFVGSFTFDGQSLPTAESPSLTYGSDGVRLLMQDTANFGDDTSGNGNDWTPTGFVAGDQTADVPGRPYNVLSDLDKTASGTIKDGGLGFNSNGGGAAYRIAKSTLPLKAKVYWEATVPSTLTYFRPGIMRMDQLPNIGSNELGGSGPTDSIGYRGLDGDVQRNTTILVAGPTPSAGNTVGFAFDPDTGKLWIALQNTWLNSGDPAAGTGEVATVSTSFDWCAAACDASTQDNTLNFGQRAFTYTPPTGFLPLHTGNLLTPTDHPQNYIAVGTRTGTGATYSVTNGPGNGTDFLWAKSRSAATDHAWYDIVRGVQQQLESNSTGAETTEATGLTAFNSTGYTAGALAQMNTSAATYVDLMLKAGGAGVANTDGTISSTVSVAAPGHFSIVKWLGTGGTATIGHGLPSEPEMIIQRWLSTTNWNVYHKAIGNTAAVFLNLTDAQTTSANYWNNTSPTSTVFSVAASTNLTTPDTIAYCFRSVLGVCKVGSYIGNGSADGPLIDLGFTARWIMIKSASTNDGGNGNWIIYDTVRGAINPLQTRIYADLSSAESAAFSSYALDILSSGFKPRSSSANFGMNTSGTTYIYLALADIPGGGDLPWPLAR